MMLLAKSLTGEEVARQLITCLSTELSIPQHLVVSMMRDRASVTTVAMRTIGVLYTHMLEVGCFSVVLGVGEHIKTPVLEEFTKAWISLFSHSARQGLHGEPRHSYVLLQILPPVDVVGMKSDHKSMILWTCFYNFMKK